MTIEAVAEAFREHASERDRRRLPKRRDLCRMIYGHENGEHTPGPQYRMLYAAAFGVGEEELFGPDRWCPVGVDPRGAFTPDDAERLALVADRPSRLDTPAIEALEAVLASQRRVEDAIGPAALVDAMSIQMDTLTGMLRETSGPGHDRFGRVVAEWTCYVGWLNAALRADEQALALFGRAEDLADDFNDRTVASVATSFRGYVARQQGRQRGVVRAACAALGAPGGHRTERAFDTLQAAQGYAALGEVETARRLLDEATDLATDAGEPPPVVYWYTEPFFRINIGVAQLGIGEHRDAAASLGSGLKAMPDDQLGSDWIREYQDAFAIAKAHS